jgi:hypothetical protein
MYNHDIDTDLISSLIGCHMCICGAEPVSSAVLHWEENKRTIVNTYVWECIHKEVERKSESSKKI